MDEQLLRKIVREEIDVAVKASEARLAEAGKASEARLAEAGKASEARLAENGRLMFRQLSDIYRSTLERIEHTEKHLGEQIAQVRGAIEALRASIERQDFRADELGRRITALETDPQHHDQL
jgi:hypothetical protein